MQSVHHLIRHEILPALDRIERKLNQMAETQDQEAADLDALTASMATIKQGILDLEAALAAAGNTTPAVDAALSSLKGAIGDAAAALPAATPPSA
jgi:septal ring factor EnvC (AmiA/AmiB activator)